jgi:hypothetical protein
MIVPGVGQWDRTTTPGVLAEGRDDLDDPRQQLVPVPFHVDVAATWVGSGGTSAHPWVSIEVACLQVC